MLHSAGSVAEHIIPCKHGVFFFENITHVIVRMAGRVYSADRGTLDLERLTIHNWLLPLTRCVLEDRFGKMRVKTNKVRDATGMVSVPVREQDLRNADR